MLKDDFIAGTFLIITLLALPEFYNYLNFNFTYLYHLVIGFLSKDQTKSLDYRLFRFVFCSYLHKFFIFKFIYGLPQHNIENITESVIHITFFSLLGYLIPRKIFYLEKFKKLSSMMNLIDTSTNTGSIYFVYK